jgi:hypothetical protein
MAARGRPTLYRPEYAQQAGKLCALGATDVEVADFFGVALATVKKWKNAHPEFVAALNAGKAEADDLVAKSLYQRARGYSHEAVKIMQYEGDVIREQYVEHYPPDTTACIFWLKNRRPHEWRDVHKIEHSGAIKTEREMSDDELVGIATAGSAGTAATTSGPQEPASVH